LFFFLNYARLPISVFLNEKNKQTKIFSHKHTKTLSNFVCKYILLEKKDGKTFFHHV
jgi:hypothetical protein